MRALVPMIAACALSACGFSSDADEVGGEGGGLATKRDYRVGEFDKVSLGGHHDVVVRVGPVPSVRAEGAAEDLDGLAISVRNGNLLIGTKKGQAWSLKPKRRTVTVYVTMPRLTSAVIGGSGDMRIDAVEGKGFDAVIGGSGDMEIGSLRVEEANLSIAGSGSIKAAGRAGNIDISVAGSGDVDASALESRSALVSIVGSGDVRAHAAGNASVSIMGSGDVVMTGGGKCKISKMGSGEVSCGS